MPRVLVVDDQADVRAMIAILLRVHHFEIVEAATTAEAITAFESSLFDVAIVDVFLQGRSGLDLIMDIRSRVPDQPVVAISGMTTLDFVTDSPELSNVVCLHKPFRPVQLMQAIETARSGARHAKKGGA